MSLLALSLLALSLSKGRRVEGPLPPPDLFQALNQIGAPVIEMVWYMVRIIERITELAELKDDPGIVARARKILEN